ncbi:MAG: metal-dependent hydrolase [Pyrinomonadaceae bacterium]
MDNVTHSLVGLAAAKAGLERVSPAATTLCVIAANAPDVDVLTRFVGPWFALKHHRGITHSIVGTLALALLLPSVFYLADRIIARLRRKPPSVSFRGLLLASLIVSATHPLMDWTNNYGLRPLLPWSAKWFYGDLVFIVDPWIWLSIGGAAFLLTSQTKWRNALWALLGSAMTLLLLFGPLGRAGVAHPAIMRAVWLIGICALIIAHQTRLKEKFGRGIAIAALAFLVAYWGALSTAHRMAFADAKAAAGQIASQRNETILRMAAMPTLGDPTHWQVMVETDRATYRFEEFLNQESREAITGNLVRFEKPQGCEAEALEQARTDERAKIFLDFARYPVYRLDGDCLSRSMLQIADLRFGEPRTSRGGTFSLEVPVDVSAGGLKKENR